MFGWMISILSSITNIFSDSFFKIAVIICAVMSLFYIDLYHKLREDVESIKQILENKKID